MRVRHFLLGALCAASVKAKTTKPNFIIFQPDEMRAESLGCYGHPVSRTPNFDSFAASATRFDQAHVSYTVCTQSRTAFMTGWPTHVRGHRTLWSLLHSWEPNLLKYLKSDGYTVKWWGKNDLLAHDSWNSSVTSASTALAANQGGNAFKFGEPGYYSFLAEPFHGRANETRDARNVAAAIDFLTGRSAPPEPFAIFLPLSLPHPPYGSPEPWHSSIDPGTLPPLRPVGSARSPDYHALIRQYRNLTNLDATFFRRLHAVYLGAISYSDHLFGELLRALDRAPNGVASRTTVAVFADHGDYAGDYGLVEKWPSGLEDVLTRVPLLIRTPGGAAGHVVHAPVQLFDIVPTVLELANIPATHVHFGTSRVAQLHGAPGDPDAAVFAEGGYSTHEPRDFEGSNVTGGLGRPRDIYYPKLLQQQREPLSVCRAASVRTATHKLVIRSDPTAPSHHSELYDLEQDPRELHNVYDEPAFATVQAALTQRLMRWYLLTSDATPWQIDPRSGGYPWPIGPHGGTAMDVATDMSEAFLQNEDVAASITGAGVGEVHTYHEMML